MIREFCQVPVNECAIRRRDGMAGGSCAFAGRSVNPWHDLAKCSTFFPSKYKGNSGKVKKVKKSIAKPDRWDIVATLPVSNATQPTTQPKS